MLTVDGTVEFWIATVVVCSLHDGHVLASLPWCLTALVGNPVEVLVVVVVAGVDFAIACWVVSKD
jgi:hypothetical protein